MENKCFNCDETGAEFYEFIICDSCKKKLRLFTDKTVEQHIKKFTKPLYKKEIKRRIVLLEKDYKKKKLKLLDILNKLEK